MARILVIYSTEEGQTAKIAQRVAESLRAREVDVVVRDCSKPQAADRLASYDGVVIGASIHYGHHAKQVRDFAREHHAILATRHTAFFSVSLSAGGPSHDAEAARQYVHEFTAVTGWKPDQVASFAGAIRHSKYGFLRTLMVRRSLRKSGAPQAGDHEYTDWAAVTAFAEAFARLLAVPKR